MMRNLVVLGCAGLLAFGLSLSGFAGAPPDADADGVPDVDDNCLIDPNGPSGSTEFCDSQEDGDVPPDGYGNTCDTDINGDFATGGDDLGDTLTAVIALSTDPKFDYNCDGGAGGDDLGRSLADTIALDPVGPSGKACAGVPPCP
jgi:hypothetical protein